MNYHYFSGFLTHSQAITYNQNGVTHHRPPFGEPIFEGHILKATFEDYNTGEITDKFWGNANDFNLSFLAAAASGKRFNIKYHNHCNSQKRYVPYDEVGSLVNMVGTTHGTIEQKEDGSWGLVDDEPLQECNGKYYLMNLEYVRMLHNGTIDGSIDEVIKRSLKNGAVVF